MKLEEMKKYFDVYFTQENGSKIEAKDCEGSVQNFICPAITSGAKISNTNALVFNIDTCKRGSAKCLYQQARNVKIETWSFHKAIDFSNYTNPL